MAEGFAIPSEAIAKAKDGDTIRVWPGEYEDCAAIRQNRLLLEGVGPNVVMKNKTCAGKAILIVSGANVTIRGLTLANAKVPNKNGAGIRAEGAALLVENTRFLDNENGLLGANDPKVSIRIADSTFIGNGQCRPTCAHGIYAGHSASLRVERSHFFRQIEGHHIKSRANRTEIVECDIADGPDGTASVLIDIPNGGTVTIEKNELKKGPKALNKRNAIMIGGEGETNPAGPIVVRDNHLTNEGTFVAFVHNFGASPAVLSGNVFEGSVKSLEGEGTVAR